MSHHSQPRDSDPGRTRIGMETLGQPGMSARGGGASPGPRLGARIGRSGNLFETHGGTPGRRLAIKLFPWAAGLPPKVVRKFTDDAARVASLRHPHVVAITEAGSLDDGTPYLITDLLPGQTLEERLEQRGALAPVEVVSIVRGVASALSVAHAAGVIHRELRTDNVFIEETAAHSNGFPRLLDFGVARLTAGARSAGRILRDASAGEVAPELRRDHGEGADHAADQFALASLTYRLLRGTAAPYGAPGTAAFQRLWEQPARLDSGGRSATAAVIDAVLARAMSWSPERRFDSVASFLRAFEDALASPPSPPVRVAPSPPSPPSPSSPPVRVAPAPPPPPSLTQQFFAEGDRQEAATLAQAAVQSSPPVVAADAAAEDGDDDDELEAAASSGTFEHVPRRRAPLVAAAALALAALAIIARTAVRSAHDDAPAWAQEAAAALPAAPRPSPALSPPGEKLAPPPRPSSGVTSPPAPVVAPVTAPLVVVPVRLAHRRGVSPAPLAPAATPLVTPAPPPAADPTNAVPAAALAEIPDEDLSPAAPVPAAEAPAAPAADQPAADAPPVNP